MIGTNSRWVEGMACMWRMSHGIFGKSDKSRGLGREEDAWQVNATRVHVHHGLGFCLVTRTATTTTMAIMTIIRTAE